MNSLQTIYKLSASIIHWQNQFSLSKKLHYTFATSLGFLSMYEIYTVTRFNTNTTNIAEN